MEVAACLRDRMARGDWTRVLPGEIELARELKVGRNTIRAALAVLEKEGLVRTATGKRREVMPAVSKKRKQLVRVAVILLPLPWQSLPPATLLLIDALRLRLHDAGWQLQMVAEAAAFRRSPGTVLASLVARYPSAVWILYRSTATMQRWFEKKKLSAVIAGSCHPGISLPQVDTDFRAASRHAAERLLGLGHRRLLALAPVDPFPGDEESLRGFQEGVAAVEGASLLVFPIKDSKTSVIQALRRIWCIHERPTGIFILEARHTATTLTFLAQQAVGVPGDISLVSRDPDVFLTYLVPEPAHYERQPEAFAKKLEHLVIALGSGLPLKRSRHLLMPNFVRGETLGRPPVPKKDR